MPGAIQPVKPASTSENSGVGIEASKPKFQGSKKPVKSTSKVTQQERDENQVIPPKRLYHHSARSLAQRVAVQAQTFDPFVEAEAEEIATSVNKTTNVTFDIQKRLIDPGNDSPEKDDDIARGLQAPQSKPKIEYKQVNAETSSERGNFIAAPKVVDPNEKKYINTGLDGDKPPVSAPDDIFEDMSRKAYANGFDKAINHISQRKLRIATMCSGTESPVLALRLITQALKRLDLPSFQFDHLFSCEIEAFKQSYIQRNFNPPLLFRDVTELAEDKATTVYGAEVTVPGGVDILIAGSSCVDYSMLNSFRKAYGQDGESKNTMTGVLDYAKVYKPKIVILENVKTAPWDKIEEDWYGKGYVTQVAIVDSKDFYIPQTRERGYMVAFHEESAPDGFDCKTACSAWLNAMQNLVRRASSPFTDFIFHDDDPRLQEALRDMIFSQLFEKPNGQRGWELCRQRYLNTRAAFALGFQRPYTSWQNNATCAAPDYAWHSWFKNQRERIWDTLDINHLRYVAWRDYHLAYKSRSIDLSQNTDYEGDRRAWGIVGCLTPSGMPFYTLRCGPITGRESLALQGIPIDQLSLTRETSRQLQDLAGNAMTSTVVGSAIISALTAAFEMLDMTIAEPELKSCNKDITDEVMEEAPSFAHERKCALRQVDFEHEPTDDTDFNGFKQLACSTFQLCACEGLATNKTQKFRECRDCGHTTCIICGGKPLHNYAYLPGSTIQERTEPSRFEQKLKAYLPARLQIANLDPAKLIQSLPANIEKKRAFPTHLRHCFEAELHFAKARRGRTWKLIYESHYSHLALTFRRDLSFNWSRAMEPRNIGSAVLVEWALFAKPESTAPARSSQRALLAEPIARMTCTSSLLEGVWEICIPCETIFPMNVEGSGRLVDSWEKRQGLQHAMFAERQVWSEITISPAEPEQENSLAALGMSGKYRLLQDCDTACGSLHKKMGLDTNKEPIFFFLDPYHLGNASNDSFVWATTHNRLSPGEHRALLAKVVGPWRPDAGNSGMISCVINRKWYSCLDAYINPMALESQVKRWLPTGLGNIVVTQNNCRTTSRIMLKVEIPLSILGPRFWRSAKVVEIDLTQAHAVTEVASLIQNAARPLASSQWRRMKSSLVRSRCTDCAPYAPSLQWWVVEKKKQDRSIGTAIKPFENPQEAHEFETKVRSRPPAAIGRLSRGQDCATFTVEMRIPPLIHQTQAKLLGTKADYSQKSDIHFRLVDDHGYDQMELFPHMTLLSNDMEEPSEQPPSFRMSLWSRQLKALKWMISQESHSFWPEKEMEEVRLAYLKQRLEVLVTVLRTIRGGVLADEVGFGKTATVLGLVDIQASGPNASTRPKSGFLLGEKNIHLKATVVFVPVNLIIQWQNEVKKYLGEKYEVLIIPSSSYLTDATYTLQRFLDADIILTNWNVFDDNYFEKLRHFTDAPEVPGDSGRAFREWFEQMLGELGILVQSSKGCQPDSFWDVRDARKGSQSKHEKFARLSRRRKAAQHPPGKALEASIPAVMQAQKRPASESCSKTAPKRQRLNDKSSKSKEDPRHLSLLLHMFSFDRLVLDEFTYAIGQPLEAVSALKADKKWILSGTPPLGSLVDVNSMAKLLGTKIGEDDDLGCIFQGRKAFEEKAKDKTLAELFQSYERRRSPAWYAEKHCRAQEFLDTFVRQNPSCLATIKQETHFEVITLAASERATYFELFQHLVVKNVQFGGEKKKASDKVKSTRAEQLLEMINMSTSPEDALLTCCSMLIPFSPHTQGPLPGRAVCDAILEEKTEEICETMRQLYEKVNNFFGHHRAWGRPTAAENPYVWIYLRCIEKNRYGDLSFSTLMNSVLFHIDSDTRDVQRGRSKSDHKTEQKRRLPAITELSGKLVDQIRSRRFFKMIHLALKEEGLPPCSCCKQIIADASHALIMGLCGHISCASCYQDTGRRRAFSDQCVDLSCSAAAPQHSAILASDFSHDTPMASTSSGSKLNAVIDLLRDTERIAADEFALVFVQYDRLRAALAKSLHANNIPFADASKPRWEDGMKPSEITKARKIEKLGRASTAAVIERFKEKKAGKVCILKVDSTDAAGWNLPVANHVIFLSTLVTRTQQKYNAIMTQAVGRARRWGQKKVVHVYHFVAANTIDVNILQQHEHKTLVKRDDTFLLVDRHGVCATDRVGWEGTPFQGAASGTGDLEVDMDDDVQKGEDGDE